MINPIQRSDTSKSVAPSDTDSKQERQRLSEILFATDVISIFVAVTSPATPVEKQLSKIKKGAAEGESPDELASRLNGVIGEINEEIPAEKAPLPPFNFSTQTVDHFILMVEKFLNRAAETKKIKWSDEEKLFGELSNLLQNSGQTPPEQIFSRLNGVIAEANNALPPQYKLPTKGT